MGELIDDLPHFKEFLSNLEATKMIFSLIFGESYQRLNYDDVDQRFEVDFPAILMDGEYEDYIYNNAYYEWSSSAKNYLNKISVNKKIFNKIKGLIVKLSNIIVSRGDYREFQEYELSVIHLSYLARLKMLKGIRDEMKQEIHEAKENFNEFISKENIEKYTYEPGGRRIVHECKINIKSPGWCALHTYKSLKKLIKEMEVFAKDFVFNLNNNTNQRFDSVLDFYNKLNSIKSIDDSDFYILKTNISMIIIKLIEYMELKLNDEKLSRRYLIRNSIFVLNDDENSQIDFNFLLSYYQQHENDEIGSKMKNFKENMEDIQNCLSTSIYRIIVDNARKGFKPIPQGQKMFSISFISDLRNNLIFYTDRIPLKLRSNTDKYVNHLFENQFFECIRNTQYQEVDVWYTKLKLPNNALTLDEQKIWFCLYTYINLSKDHVLYALSAATFPWYIDDESEDAKELEVELREYFRSIAKYKSYKDDMEQSMVSKYNAWVRFAMNNLWYATEPLDFDFLKRGLEVIPFDFEGCCNVQ